MYALMTLLGPPGPGPVGWWDAFSAIYLQGRTLRLRHGLADALLSRQ